MNVSKLIGFSIFCTAGAIFANATLLTETSLTTGEITTVILAEIVGIVVYLVAINGTRVISQLLASSLHDNQNYLLINDLNCDCFSSVLAVKHTVNRYDSANENR